MNETPLIVLSAHPSSPGEAAELVRRARRLLGALGEGSAILLLCSLPDADASRLPQDDALIRMLKSGVMSADARLRGRLLLLVCPRVWDDAARAFVGRNDSAYIAACLLTGKDPGLRFEAASFSPSSLKDAHACALLMPDAYTCTPDVPRRMASSLGTLACLAGDTVPAPLWNDTLLTRLERAGFDLSPVREAASLSLMREGLAMTQDRPVMLSREMLDSVAQGEPLPRCCPLAPDCIFVRRDQDTPHRLLETARARQAEALAPSARSPFPSREALEAVLPVGELILLALSAALGSPLLAGIAVFAPEWYALLHPRQLPGLMARLALLPAHATGALDALLRRLLARSRAFRIEMPAGAFSPRACVVCGMMLLLGAILTTRALAPLLVISLFWLFAPMIFAALSSPVSERIPLSEAEQEELLTLARTACFRLPEGDPCLHMLAACAGCMLGLFEPDEAARRAEALLGQLEGAPGTALDQACLLASAQYLREHMSSCDAALRPLPAQIEAAASTMPLPDEPGLLAALLRAARSGDTSAIEPAAMPDPVSDALFLPSAFAARIPAKDALLPLTHPHTFLSHPQENKGGETDDLLRFLALSASALHEPFAALLARSPAVEAYMPLLARIPPQGKRTRRALVS